VTATKSAPRRLAARLFRAVFGALLAVVPKLTPRAKKLFWRWFYEAVSIRRRNVATMLLNYGYAPDDESDELDAGDDRFGYQLYAAVAGATDLSGKDLLEVGCGRGGGAAFVFERFGPRSLTGLDLARTAIESGREQYARPGLRFQTGDAEDLPFPDGAFDAILSVESSHCYPNMRRFLGEVRRVLRPGGVLLFADFRRSGVPPPDGNGQPSGEDVATLRAQLADTGFRTVEEEDITANVVRALKLSTPSVRARIERRVPRPLQNYAREFAAVEGSAVYKEFAHGGLTYLRFMAEKA
jgi:SAM-dependent methyltransferase